MSNTWVTCPRVRDNLSKDGLIPDTFTLCHVTDGKMGIRKDLSPLDGPAAYQLVGEVMSHKGYDGLLF